MGHPVPGGYRRKLYIDLTEMNLKVDMLGSLDSNCADDMDCDHEGHVSWRVDQVRGKFSAIEGLEAAL